MSGFAWEKFEKTFTILSKTMDKMSEGLNEAMKEMDEAFKDVPHDLPKNVIEEETTVTEKQPDGTVIVTKTVIRKASPK